MFASFHMSELCVYYLRDFTTDERGRNADEVTNDATDDVTDGSTEDDDHAGETLFK